MKAKRSVRMGDYNEDHSSMWVNKGGRVNSIGGGHIGGDKEGSNKGRNDGGE